MMKWYSILIAWLLTVLIGSIVISFVLFVSGTNFSSFYGFLEIVFMFICASGLFSSPTVVLLILKNEQLKKQTLSKKEYVEKINKTHLLLSILTYLFISSYLFLFDNNARNFSIALFFIMLTYIICALPIWYLTYKYQIFSTFSMDLRLSEKS